MGDYQGKLDLIADLTRRIEVTRDLRRELVKLSRAQGYTWAEIGRALGITKQAAQQKYGKESH